MHNRLLMKFENSTKKKKKSLTRLLYFSGFEVEKPATERQLTTQSFPFIRLLDCFHASAHANLILSFYDSVSLLPFDQEWESSLRFFFYHSV